MRRIVLIMISLLLVLAAPVSAQYSIPDCFVAAINGITMEPEFHAARDEHYRQMSGDWLAETAGLTAAQLTAYTAAACATLSVWVESEDAESRTIGWSYIPVDVFLEEQGSLPPASNGGGSNDSPAPSTAGSNSGGASGATGSANPSNAASQPAAANEAPSGILLYSTDFDTMPDDIEVLDSDYEIVTTDLIDEEGDNALRLNADEMRILYLVPGLDWSDYAFEARLRLTGGSLTMTARGGEELCAGYDLALFPADNSASLGVTDADCNNETLDEALAIGIAEGEWFTVRIEARGNQISTFVNGAQVMNIVNDDLTSGYPSMFLFPDEGVNATADISFLRVYELASAPSQLSQYAASPTVAMAELRELGLVPAGGVLVFQEPVAFFEGEGYWYTPLARNAPRTNVVMAGEMNATFAANDYESCTLLARVTSAGGDTEKMVEVGIDTDNDLILYDWAIADGEPTTFEYTGLPTDLTEPQHLLFILMGDRLSVYLNGNLMFADVQVEERSGSFGIALVGEDGDSRCEGRNIWVWSLD